MSENQSRSSTEKDLGEECRRINIEGATFLGFGFDAGATYEQAWTWVMMRQRTLNEVMSECSLMGDAPLNFASLFHRKREVMRKNAKLGE